MADEWLTFAQMCARFDVTPRTLRYYEQIELLSPERKGRSRFYGARELARMTLILRGRRFGFALEAMRQWLLMYDQKGSPAQLQAFVTTADSQIAIMIAKAKALEADIDDLRALRNQAMQDISGLGD